MKITIDTDDVIPVACIVLGLGIMILIKPKIKKAVAKAVGDLITAINEKSLKKADKKPPTDK